MKKAGCFKAGFMAALFLVIAWSFLTPSQASEALPKAMAIGTSSLGSSAYIQTVGMANLLRKHLGIDMTVEAIGGPSANVNALASNKIALMTGSSMAPSHAVMGIEEFAGKKVPLRLITQGYATFRYLIVDASIKSPADLKGKVFLGEKPGTSDYKWITDALLAAYNISPSDVKIVRTGSTNESIKAFRLGRANGFICGGGVPLGTLMSLASEKEFNILPIEDKIDDMLDKLPPGFSTDVIPGGTYKGVKDDRQQLAMRMGLVSRGDLSEETVYQIIKTFYQHFDEFKVVHKEAGDWGLKKSVTNATFAFHPGAVRYYKEANVWTPRAEERQKKFLQQVGETK